MDKLLLVMLTAIIWLTGFCVGDTVARDSLQDAIEKADMYYTCDSAREYYQERVTGLNKDIASCRYKLRSINDILAVPTVAPGQIQFRVGE